MSKGEATKQMILEEAARLLNRRGYLAASISEIMEATGLQKGGIYNHFASKEDLALQVFDYAIAQVRGRFVEALSGHTHAIDRLVAVLTVFRGYSRDVPLPGGCPIGNLAIESDDTHPVFREKAREAMDSLHGMCQRILAKGKERGEVVASADPEAVATVIVAALEGGVMLANLYKDSLYMRQVIDHLSAHIGTLRA